MSIQNFHELKQQSEKNKIKKFNEYFNKCKDIIDNEINNAVKEGLTKVEIFLSTIISNTPRYYEEVLLNIRGHYNNLGAETGILEIEVSGGAKVSALVIDWSNA